MTAETLYGAVFLPEEVVLFDVDAVAAAVCVAVVPAVPEDFLADSF